MQSRIWTYAKDLATISQLLFKMVNNPELNAKYPDGIRSMKELDEQFARGWRVVAQGWAIDKGGGVSSWAITTKDPKGKSFLQKMSEKKEEIRQKQLEEAKDAEEWYLGLLCQ